MSDKTVKTQGNYMVCKDGQRVAGFATLEDRRLFESAPDLLEALQIVRRDIEAYCEDHNSEHPTDVTVCLPTLQIAIAKATGAEVAK
tara:strand:- start:325 stop:585 length:261 start_codon:yes stop_codon:yes gene_type:complete